MNLERATPEDIVAAVEAYEASHLHERMTNLMAGSIVLGLPVETADETMALFVGRSAPKAITHTLSESAEHHGPFELFALVYARGVLAGAMLAAALRDLRGQADSSDDQPSSG